MVGHHRAGHVAGQEIGGALDAVERAADRGRDDLRQQRLADPRDVLDQQVAARQQAGGGHLGDLALAGDDTIDGIDDVAPEAARAAEFGLVETSRITGGRAVAATLTVPGLGRSSSAHRHPRPPRRQVLEPARGARRQLFQIIGTVIATQAQSWRTLSRAPELPFRSRSPVLRSREEWRESDWSECEMKSECLVECGLQRGSQRSDLWADALNGDRSDLLCLCLRVCGQPGVLRDKQHLKGVDVFDIRCHGDDCDDPAVRGVVRCCWRRRY